MTNYTLTTQVDLPYEATVDAVHAALAEQGFGILTEIDLSGALKEKLGVDLPRQVILGACRPPLAYEAIKAEPSIAAVLPCNVLVRSLSETSTQVEAFDPLVMTRFAESDHLDAVARDARERINSALASLIGDDPTTSSTLKR